jgi:hypothetical protein
VTPDTLSVATDNALSDLWRMHNQRLWGTPMKAAEDVVRRLCAMQAQEFVPAKWSIAQRCGGVTDAAMDEAFAAGTILRTHVVRPTWHFVLPEDIRWLLDLTGPRVNALNASYYRRFGLDDEAFARCNLLLSKALDGGDHLTRKQIAAWLDRNGVRASGPHLAYILMRAELDAVICSGAPSGKQQTYAFLDDRVPAAKRLPRAAALAELTRRYVVSRGPVTLKDYVRWSSLTAADARAGLEMVRSELDHAEIGGRT